MAPFAIVAVNAERERKKAEIRKSSQLEGWLTAETRDGKHPTYSYPPNELPKIHDARMPATVGFMSAAGTASVLGTTGVVSTVTSASLIGGGAGAAAGGYVSTL
jgi:hypothetical protein